MISSLSSYLHLVGVGIFGEAIIATPQPRSNLRNFNVPARLQVPSDRARKPLTQRRGLRWRTCSTYPKRLANLPGFQQVHEHE